MVKDDYLYYHYMQDGFNDNVCSHASIGRLLISRRFSQGWGCAYRSLQTLYSWFVAQGYTSTAVPSIPQIQRALVDMGDKPRTFAGSREWIGAVEVGMVLDALLHVQYRILNMQSGAMFAEHAAEMAEHFDTYGTPVMIGTRRLIEGLPESLLIVFLGRWRSVGIYSFRCRDHRRRSALPDSRSALYWRRRCEDDREQEVVCVARARAVPQRLALQSVHAAPAEYHLTHVSCAYPEIYFLWMGRLCSQP